MRPGQSHPDFIASSMHSYILKKGLQELLSFV